MERHPGRWWVAVVLVILVVAGWWGLRTTDGSVPDAPSTTRATATASSPAIETAPPTTAGPPGPFTDVEPAASAMGADVATPAGTFHFEVVGHSVQSVYVLPDLRAPDGTYARIQWVGVSGVVEASNDGVNWTPLIPTATFDNPMLAGSASGVLVVSYRSTGGTPPAEEWSFWRHDGDAWHRLDGFPIDAGSPVIRSTLPLATGEELFVTYARGPLADIVHEIPDCPAVAGVAIEEPWPSVVIGAGCGPEASVVGTVSLLGDDESSFVILRDNEGREVWRSESGHHVGTAFGRLLDLALVTGPDLRVVPSIFLWGGGRELFWTSADGDTFELASSLEPWPYPIAPVVMNGSVFVLVPDISLVQSLGEWMIGESSAFRVMVSDDGATWTDEAVDIVLEEVGDLWDIALTASTREVLIQLPGRDLVRSEGGTWREVDVPDSLAPLQAIGDAWAGLRFVWGLDAGPQFAVSSDLEQWHRFSLGDASSVLGCGDRPSEWRVVGDELWFSTRDDRGVCIIRGRFESTP